MTTIAPLIFVIVVTAIKQGYEDFLRHKADREVNNREATVVREGVPITIKAMDIKVSTSHINPYCTEIFRCMLQRLKGYSS